MKDWKATQQARAVAAQALHAAFPYLVPVSSKVDALQAAAKNIRIELKRAFPGVVFSVKSSRFSMGNAVDVRWTDGPIVGQVEEIINRYSAGSFDGMTDCYNYSRDAWTDAFGSTKYVHATRDDSDAAIASAIRTVAGKYAGNLADVGLPAPSVESYKKGDYMRVSVLPGARFDDLQSLIRREASCRTWAISKAAAPAATATEGA